MTEQEWLTSEDPAAMLSWAKSPNVDPANKAAQCEANRRLSDRKLRLWVEACRHAAGGSDYFDIYNAGLRLAVEYWCGEDGRPLSRADRAALLRDIVGNPWQRHRPPRWRTRNIDGSVTHRECPWLTPTALSLAQAAYDERLPDGTLDPARLAVLADALEDDGCEDGPLLRHLRGWERCRPCLGRLRDGRGGPVGGTCPACFDSGWVRSPSHHVRGCWALDLVLGKE